MSAQAAPARTGMFYGWWIVITGCIFSFYGYSVYAYAISNFVPIWNKEFGWSFAQIGLAFTTLSVLGGIEGPFAGWAVDKFGPRYIQMLVFTTGGIGFMLVGWVMTELWQFFLFYSVIVNLSFNVGTYFVANKAIASWFLRRRALAMGTMTLVAVIGAGPVAVPLFRYLIDTITWRNTLGFLGIGAIILVPFALIYRKETPEQLGMRVDGDVAPPAPVAGPAQPVEPQYSFTLPQAIRTMQFWGICLVYMFAFTMHWGLNPNAIVWLTRDAGMSRVDASNFYGWMFALGLFGRMSVTFFGDRLYRRGLLGPLVGVFVALNIIGGVIMYFAVQNPPLAIFGLVVYGLGYGAIIPWLPITMAAYFGRGNFAKIYGTAFPWLFIISVPLPYLAGWIIDTTGSVRPYFLVGMGGLSLALIFSQTVVRRRPKLPQEALDMGYKQV